jgi:hypothetical protein
MHNDQRPTTDDFIRDAHALRTAAIAGMFGALVRILFRRKPRSQVAFG